MPNIPSAAKRARQALVRRDRNRAVKSRIRSTRRKFLEALEAKDKPKAEALYREYSSVLDRAARTGIIKKNNASRHKARAAHHLTTVPASA